MRGSHTRGDPAVHDPAGDCLWAQHVTGNGWTDIAYQYAIDQAGRCFQLRGFEYRSAANGTADVNRRFGAVTFLIGTGDTPTVAAVEAFRAWRAHVWLPQYPRAVKVAGHRDLHATQCPGTALYRLVTSGALSRVPVTIPTTPIPIGGLPVALDKADIRAIADALMSADAVYQVHVPGSDDTEGVTASLAELRRGVAEISARLDAIAERLPQ